MISQWTIRSLYLTYEELKHVLLAYQLNSVVIAFVSYL